MHFLSVKYLSHIYLHYTGVNSEAILLAAFKIAMNVNIYIYIYLIYFTVYFLVIPQLSHLILLLSLNLVE